MPTTLSPDEVVDTGVDVRFADLVGPLEDDLVAAELEALLASGWEAEGPPPPDDGPPRRPSGPTPRRDPRSPTRAARGPEGRSPRADTGGRQRSPPRG